MGYVCKINVLFTTSLDLSFDCNIPTFLNHGWAKIEEYLLSVFFF